MWGWSLGGDRHPVRHGSFRCRLCARPVVVHQSEKLSGDLKGQHSAVLSVDLDHPAQRCEGIDVHQAVLGQRVEARLRRGPETREPVREQHDELLALAAYPLAPGALVVRENLRQSEQLLPAGTTGAEPGARLGDRFPAPVPRVGPLHRLSLGSVCLRLRVLGEDVRIRCRRHASGYRR
ncbi:MAG: hypothetical protein P8Y27_14240 [Chromatiaceae bacterium]